MERGNMSKREAAILLVDMISDLRGSGADNQMYHEAVAIACAELMKLEKDGKTQADEE